jgi:hypothetical protein
MNRKNLLIDLAALAAFLVAGQPRLTGNMIHEWLSLALAGTLIVHLLLHWKWVTNVGLNYFKKLFHISRLKFVVDMLLFGSMTAVMTSGIMISHSVVRTLGIELAHNPQWKMIHSMSARAALIMVGLHLLLNWKWVWNMLKTQIVFPVLGKRAAVTTSAK